MQRRRWAGLAVLLSAATARADCGCGPDFYLHDPRLPGIVAAKTAAMKRDGAPDRFIALFKPACVAAATRAPAGFSLKIVGKDDSKLTIAWTPDDERIARQDLASGKVKRYWIFNVAHVLPCCAAPTYDKRPDYNPLDDINTGGALLCDPRHPC